MVIPGLSPVLRRAVHVTQSFSRCRGTRDTWRSGQCRVFSKNPEELDSDDAKKPKQKPKTEPVPKITLMSPGRPVSVTVLEEAQRLAKRRNLTLVKVSDLESKTQRPLYKLVTSTGVLEDTEEGTKGADRAAQKSIKDTKLFYISAKITEHDLQTKTKNVMRLLSKGHKAKIVITLDGADGGKMQRVIEDAVRNDGSVERMPSKKNTIVLVISPLHKNKDISVDNETRLETPVINERDNI